MDDFWRYKDDLKDAAEIVRAIRLEHAEHTFGYSRVSGRWELSWSSGHWEPKTLQTCSVRYIAGSTFISHIQEITIGMALAELSPKEVARGLRTAELHHALEDLFPQLRVWTFCANVHIHIEPFQTSYWKEVYTCVPVWARDDIRPVGGISAMEVTLGNFEFGAYLWGMWGRSGE
jgi:hypothetical protein